MSYLYFYRKQRRLSQSEVAGRMGVSQSAWAAWEAGERPAPMHILLEVCPEHAPPKVTDKHLKFFRRHLGLTQAQAAELCGTSATTWCKWERGFHQPPTGFGYVLQNALKDPHTRPMTMAQLRRFRKTYSVTRARIAEHFGVCEDTVTGWEIGREAMPLDMGERLARLATILTTGAGK